MSKLRQLGCDAFVEIGPQPVLVKRLGAEREGGALYVGLEC